MMKLFIYLMYLYISMIYVYGQGNHNHQYLSGIHINAPGQYGNELNQPALHLPPGATINDARAAGVIPDIVNTDSKGISNNNLQTATSDVTLNNRLHGSKLRNTGKAKIILDLFRKQTAPLSESTDVNGLQRSEFGILDNRSVLLTNFKGNSRRDKRRGGRRRGRNRGGSKKRRTTTTTSSTTTTTTTTQTTTTTTTTSSPKKSGGNNGIMIIKTSRPNPFASLGNVLRSALNVKSGGNGGLLGSLIGPSLVQQSSGPIRLQPVGRPLFGGLFGGR